ncbi:AMP-binding protein [Ureibacillus sp. FSL K6-3587]|uniref:AMP-dependent synthetase/ligase n=1 Tax=Ureibacillus sp. FSL K6-3587 TaxID=2954681 RepID=UPI003159643A
MVKEVTLPFLLVERANQDSSGVALRQKQLGIWKEITWNDYLENVKKLSIALHKHLDFKAGEILAIIGENKPQWLYAQLATQTIGGISAGIYQESLPEQIRYYLNDLKPRIVIVEDQEQVDKLLSIEKDIPFVEHIVHYDVRGLRHYQNSKLISMKELLKIGEEHLKVHPAFFEQQITLLSGHQEALISYSAATSGDPKAAVYTHHQLIEAAKNLIQLDEMKKTDDYFSFLPLAWIHEQIMGIVIPIVIGLTVNFPERPDTVIGDLREIGPQTVVASPRVYQSIMSNVQVRLEGASWLNRKVYQLFKKYGDKRAKAKLEKIRLSAFDRFMYFLGDAIVFSAIRDHLGFARTRRAYVIGAALHPEAFYFYHGIGVNIKQTYGGTEVAGIAIVQRDDDIKAGSSGVALPNTEVKIGIDGLVYLKNNAIFSRYLKPEHQRWIVDGWISLGDKGFIDKDGHLFILDRKEDVIVMPKGEIYPHKIENIIKSSPYIQEAVVVGKNRPFLTALINIDMTTVGRWADKRRIIYTEFSDLSVNKDVIEFIEQEMIRLMDELPPQERVKKIILLPKQFTADAGELTRTLKIRRNHVENTYKDLIDAMYSNNGTVQVRISEAEIPLRIIQLERNLEVTEDVLIANAY